MIVLFLSDKDVCLRLLQEDINATVNNGHLANYMANEI